MTIYNIPSNSDDGEFDGTTWNAKLGTYSGDEFFRVGDKSLGRGGGLRFTNITDTGTVSSATLTVTLRGNAGKNMTLTVHADDVDNAPALSGTSNPGTGWTDTSASATVNALSSDAAGTTYQFNVASIVQEIFDRAGWSSGNAMRFAVRYTAGSPTYNELQLYDTDADHTDEAVLEIVTGAGGGLSIPVAMNSYRQRHQFSIG